MQSAFRYILEPYSGKKSRYRCPGCQDKKSLSRYIDTETGEQLAEYVGRCDREVKCGYHYTPKQYFQDNGEALDGERGPFRPAKPPVLPEPGPASFIPFEAFKKSHGRYEQNYFVTYLISLFGGEVTNQLISRYFIGTSKHWPGATVFYQVDSHGRVRRGKIMLYSPTTGRRLKEPYNHITSVHAALKLHEPKPEQCLFGEHLLCGNSKPIAIVESEKTAIIASQYAPGFIWLATGGLSNLAPERCSALTGRKVFLFPDLGAYDKWNEKAKSLTGIASLQVIDLLEKKATQAEREEGLDIADFFIRVNFKDIPGTELKPAAPAKKIENTAAGHVVTTVPESVPAGKYPQASFDKLKAKYPAIGALEERLELEVVC